MTNDILETMITEVYTLSHSLHIILILQLAPVHLNRYHDNLLFISINGGDLMQILAAAEL